VNREMPDAAQAMPPASFVEGLARATGIFDPSPAVVYPASDPALADYKVQVARMLREKAEYWQRMAGRHHDNATAAATALAYRNAYRDAANLIELGEVAW
jgi:hypothetical protein